MAGKMPQTLYDKIGRDHLVEEAPDGTSRSDDAAEFDREVRLDVAALPPLVTWGTNP